MPNDDIDLLGIVAILRRRALTIAATLIVTLSIFLVVIFTITPIYTATTLLMVGRQSSGALSSSTETNMLDQARIDSALVLASSPEVLLRVISDQGLIDDPDFRGRGGILTALGLREPVPQTPDSITRQALARLSELVTVQRRGESFLLSITARSSDPDKAARLANGVAQAYIDTQSEARAEAARRASSQLEAQLAQTRAEVAALDDAHALYLERNLDRMIAASGDAQLTALRDQLTAATMLRQATAARIASLETRLTTTASGLSDTLDLEMATLRTRLRDAEATTDTLRQSLRSAVLDADLPADILTEIYELQQSAELVMSRYDSLLSRSHNAGAADLQMPDGTVVSAALRPDAPVWPNRRLLMILGGIMGLAIGVVVALMREHAAGAITTQSQLAAATGRPLALAIPKVANGQGLSLADAIAATPLSPFSEALRRMRNRLDQTVPSAGEGRVIAVTSSQAGEGRTTIALAMARIYALSGRSTLLIDCDLRHPTVHRHVGAVGDRGLFEALAEDDASKTLATTMSRDHLSGLTIMISPNNSTVPTDDLLGGEKFERLIAAARHTFDLIVLDTPPLGTTSDGAQLVRQADAVIFLARHAKSGEAAVSQAMAMLRASLRSGAEVMPVLNLLGHAGPALPFGRRSKGHGTRFQPTRA